MPVVGTFKPLEEYKEEAWSCSKCNWCKLGFGWNLKSARFRYLCPSFTRFRFDAYSAQGRMNIARALIEGEMEWKESEKLLEIIYLCDTCGACAINCIRIMENNPVEVIEALRAKLVKLGIGPMPAHKRFGENTLKTYNVFGESHNARFSWVTDEIKPSKNSELCFFSGCVASYRQMEIAKASLKLLKAADVEYVFIDEWCCGSPLFRTGQWDSGLELVKHNVEQFKKMGISKIVTPCPGCYKCLKLDYPKLADGFDFEVLHTVELIEELYNKGKLKFKPLNGETITYHDPCHLGRWLGVYDPPRNLLSAIGDKNFVEMERKKDQAWCCGAGGGVLAAFRDQTMFASKERIMEAKSVGASLLVSACPFCAIALKDAIKKVGEKIVFTDINELLSGLLLK